MTTMKKRFLALLMTLALAIGFTTSAFAAEPAKSKAVTSTSVSEEVDAVSVSEGASTRASLGDVIAAGSGAISGGSGSLSIYLSSGNFWADIVAQIDSVDVYSNVSVTCSTPNGDIIPLGTIAGSNSRTISYEVFYASAGTYTFYFTSAIPTTFYVSAYIYD